MDVGRIARTLNRTELLAVDQLARELMTTA
jgi:hypothetical protein